MPSISATTRRLVSRTLLEAAQAAQAGQAQQVQPKAQVEPTSPTLLRELYYKTPSLASQQSAQSARMPSLSRTRSVLHLQQVKG